MVTRVNELRYLLLGMINTFFFNYFFLGFFLILNSCEEKCSYIRNYYQQVYLAQLEYYQGDYEECYQLMLNATENCDLINQEIIYEAKMFAECATIVGEEKVALEVVEYLLKNGYSINYIEKNSILSKLTQLPKFNELRNAESRFKELYSKSLNLKLRDEIIQMFFADQQHRKKLSYTTNRDSLLTLINDVDSVNELKMKSILSTYGYPSNRLIGDYNIDNTYFNVITMFMHFKDTSFFKEILLKEIDNGMAPPAVLANMIDSRRRFLHREDKYLYAIYNNIQDNQVFEIDQLDQRRKQVGLPPRSLEKEIKNLRGLNF